MGSETIVYEREDWTLFRNLETLGQKAGVPLAQIPRLVVKELVDNALDANADEVTADFLIDRGIIVRDNGAGIPGSDAQVASLFSFRRPLRSSKLIRLPTRGALGNGLRVVAGAVAASSGNLIVRTRGRALSLTLTNDGTTAVTASRPWDGVGTEVEVHLGEGLSVYLQSSPLLWGRMAIGLAKHGAHYKGKSSPWWYTSEAFFELCQAARDRSIRDLVAEFEGCTGAKAGQLCSKHLRLAAEQLTRDQSDALLGECRNEARKVNPRRLGLIGRDLLVDSGYAKSEGEIKVSSVRGSYAAWIPFVIEVWAIQSDQPEIQVYVNRSPITAQVDIRREADPKTDYAIFGGNLAHRFEVGKKHNFEFLINVTCPYMPITTDGKSPDLSKLEDEILTCLSNAAKKRSRATRGGGDHASQCQKDFILGAIEEAIKEASGEGKSRYSLRQLFYAIRPRFQAAFNGVDPLYSTFTSIIGDYEEDVLGHDLPGIYRDNRGTIYHPHTRQEIPLGTLSVEAYRRPVWNFNKILYCEKEGFFPLLKDARWPERNDCALLTSKGFATRAVRDVLKLLAASEEPLTIFCIHDADGPGTMIYQKLQEAVAKATDRRVQVINLGLEPAEGREMGLASESVRRKKGKKVSVADYVPADDRHWLQSNRIELNAMTSPQFLAWLDNKMAEYDGKVIPPSPVLATHFLDACRSGVRQAIINHYLSRIDVDTQTERAMRSLALNLTDGLDSRVHSSLAKNPVQQWRDPVEVVARNAVEGVRAED